MYQTFESIAKKYDDFSAPATNVKIDNKSIMKSSDFVVERLSVDLDIEKSNVAEIHILSIQEETQAAFKSAVQKKIMLGSTIEVQFGYGSKIETVFFGYIGKLDFSQEQDGSKGAVIYGFDVRRLMMTSVRDKSYTDTMKIAIIREVFSEYKKICKNLICDVTSSSDGNVIQNDTDYNFVVKYLLGSETPKKSFYVVGDTVYIKSLEAGLLNCVTEMQKGKGLYSFSNSGLYLDSEIEVQGYDADKAVSFKAKSKIQSEEKQKKITSVKKILGSGGISSEGEAKKIAQRIADEMQDKTTDGRAECVGIPELVTGSCVKLAIKDMGINGYFLIRGATHSFSDSDGYIVNLRFGKDELGDILAGGSGEEHKTSKNSLPKSKEDGIMLGKVVDNWDSKFSGKLLVELGIGEQGKTRTEWIPYIVPYAGHEFGICFRPEKGSQVAVGFLSGDKNMPIVIGVVRYNDTDLPKEVQEKENEIKEIVTKAGHKIVFREEKEPSIEIKTASGEQILLDGKNELISIKGKSQKNKIVIDDKSKTIEIESEKKMVLTAGNSKIELTDSGISITSGKIEIKASQQLNINGSSTSVSANSLEIKGSGSLKAESSGAVMIKGSLLKLN